jgi:AcrR family transcriptional regulator
VASTALVAVARIPSAPGTGIRRSPYRCTLPITATSWDAVTTRRLSTEIEYSQPVLYKHFTGMEQIADAIAIDGFSELADVTRAARLRAGTASDARIARAYLDFARENPAVYGAMFTRSTTLRFAAQDTPPELTASFAELRQAVGLIADEQDADALTEVLWAALHGLVTLSRAGRLRPDYDSERLQLLVNQFTGRRETMRKAKR